MYNIKLIALIFTYIFNLIDCALTMHYHSQNNLGFVELNPFGNILLDSGTAVIYKVFAMALLLGILWIYRKKRIAEIGIIISLGVYTVLMIWWLINIIITI